MKRLTPAELRDWRERLRADGEFRDIESPAGVIAHRASNWERTAYLEQARSHLWEHGWSDQQHRQIWELHADGATEREIARAVLGSESGGARRRVDAVIERHKALMLGRPKRRRGRPREDDGVTLGLRLRGAVADALYHLAEALSARAGRPVSAYDAARMAIVACARDISASGK